MDAKDYAKVLAFAKKNNPGLFNNPEKLREKLAEFDQDIKDLDQQKDTPEIEIKMAKSILIQGRNVMALALGLPMIEEPKFDLE